MTQPMPPRPTLARLADLTEQEADAVTKAALVFYAGEGALDGDTYHALHDALKKLFLDPAAEATP